jgi:hypothetical protein
MCERLAMWAAASWGFRALPLMEQLRWFETLALFAAGAVAHPPGTSFDPWVSPAGWSA